MNTPSRTHLMSIPTTHIIFKRKVRQSTQKERTSYVKRCSVKVIYANVRIDTKIKAHVKVFSVPLTIKVSMYTVFKRESIVALKLTIFKKYISLRFDLYHTTFKSYNLPLFFSHLPAITSENKFRAPRSKTD